jgi:hypothetical protein
MTSRSTPLAERIRVKRRGFTYPGDPDSLRLVREAGGLSKLTPEARARVRMKEVAVGDFCDDMPAEAQARYLERGDLERVTVDDTAPAKAAKAGGKR